MTGIMLPQHLAKVTIFYRYSLIISNVFFFQKIAKLYLLVD